LEIKMTQTHSPLSQRLVRASLSAALVAALVLVCVAPAAAAEPFVGKVQKIEIAVWELPDKDEVAQLNPGETLNLTPGQPVQVRLYSPRDGNPTGQRQYLRGQWSVKAAPKNLKVTGTDLKKGTMILEALDVGAGRKAILHFELTNDVTLPNKKMAKADIPVAIGPLPTPTLTPRPTETTPAPRLGVTLFSDSNFRGNSQIIYADDADLSNNSIGNDRATSIRVPDGCEATLYRDGNYRGGSAVLRGDASDLSRTAVGNDSVTSIKVTCSNRR
jgi:hypothetical protein